MSFKISFQSTAHEFICEGSESILDAAMRAGLTLPYGCRNGACGACKGKLVSGAVEYPDGLPMALSQDDADKGEALFCQAHPVSNLVIDAREVQAANQIPIRNFPCKVAELERLASDVMRVVLKPPASERLQFLAGQYVDILLADGKRRAFSLANPPDHDETLELHIRHVPDGEFTGHVFNTMQPREILRLEGPHGNFYLREESERPAILVGGGTGFAPLKGVLEHAFAHGTDRTLHLYWGARDAEGLYLDELPRAWEAKYPHFRYTPVLSEPADEDNWSGRRGWVTDAVAEDYLDLSDYEVYMCGPPPMIDAGRERFLGLGLVEDRLFFDSFEFAAPVSKD